MKEEFHSGFAAIMGRPNVGKSTLLNRMVGEKIAIVSDKPQTTRDRIMGIATGDGWQIVFLDTPGLHRPRNKLGEYMVKSAYNALDGVDIILAMVAADAMGEGDRAVARELAGQNPFKILLINKMDAIRRPELLTIIDEFKDMGYDHILPVSALSGEGLDELTRLLRDNLPEGPRYFPEDMITDQPERTIVGEIIREKALRLLREEIPHGIGVEILDMARLREDMTEIHANIVVERDSHKNIVIGKHAAMLKKLGTNARQDIERFLGTRANLQLWVRVKPNWRNSVREMREFGYDNRRDDG